MDELDIKILRELFQPTPFAPSREGQRPSFRTIGKKLGVSGESVARRIDRLVSSGFIKGFALFLNMNLLGLKAGALIMDVERSTPIKGLAERLSLIDGLFIIQSHVEGSIGVVFCCEENESLQKKAALISTVAGARSAKFTRVPFPKSLVSLSKNDWRIISRLQRNVDKPLGEISKELQISKRTVKRRMARLVNNGVIFTLASGNVTAIRGAIMADLVVEYESAGQRPQADKMLLELLEPFYFSTGPWENYGLFSLILPSVSESRKILEKVRGVKGISSAKLEFVEDRYEFYDCLFEAVDKKLATLEAGSSDARIRGR